MRKPNVLQDPRLNHYIGTIERQAVETRERQLAATAGALP
jgi:hypothetical protein